MSKTRSVALALPLLFSAGCASLGVPAFWGNLLVLGITVGIFVGTLSLGRSTEATRSGSASSTTSRS